MQHRRTLLGLIVSLAVVSAGRPVHAAWTHDSNANLLLGSSVSGEDLLPAMTSDGAGGAIIAWFDARTGIRHIYAQRVNAKGAPLWPAGGVAVCLNANDQSYPTIVPDGSGGALITWHDLRNGNFDIFAQRVNAAGVVQWNTNGISVCTATNSQVHLASTSDGLGGVIATWLDNRDGDGGDIYAQRINGAGTVQWTTNGVALCIAINTQQIPRPISDGAGGAIIAWTDGRSGSSTYAQRVSGAGDPLWAANGINVMPGTFDPAIVSDGAGGAVLAWTDARVGLAYDIYAQRLNSAGALQWGVNGRAICTASARQERPKLISDGAGGAIVTWTDWRNSDINYLIDVYARRINGAGVAQWTGDGVALSTAFAAQDTPEIASDGAGGAIVTWEDASNGTGTLDIYARRVTAAGTPQWISDGMAVSSAPNSQVLPAIIADGRGGAILAWNDFRSGAHYDLYAQRIDDYGYIGNPEAEIVSTKDLAADQGGHVRIKWNASFRDTLPTLQVREYGIWRRVSSASAMSALAHGGRQVEPGTVQDAAPGVFRAEANAIQTIYWEGVGTVLARGEPWYTFVADTFQDSTGASNPYTVFMIDAHDAYVPIFWNSVADSGYSVDNLPPAAPAPFTGTYSAGAAHLDWGPNLENDLAGYRLYRGATFGFVPGPGNQVASTTGTHSDDPGPSGSFYKLSAVDVHGNASGYAVVAFSTVDASNTAMPRELAMAKPSPNPARSSATLRFAIPQSAEVSLAIYDAGGRRVRSLVDGPLPAGEHTIGWDLRDDRGAFVASALYFVRLESGGHRIMQRMTCIR